jgi:hypothetical protein
MVDSGPSTSNNGVNGGTGQNGGGNGAGSTSPTITWCHMAVSVVPPVLVLLNGSRRLLAVADIISPSPSPRCS